MESSGARLYCVLRNRDFIPSHCQKVEDPKIIQVSNSFSSEYNQVRIEEFGCVVSPCPGSSLIGLRADLQPVLGSPVEDINCIKTLFVRTTSSEDDEPVVILVVVHRAVGAIGGNIPFCLDFCPFHSDGIESPDVIHIVGVYMLCYLPAQPPKKTTQSSMSAQECPQRRLGSCPVLSLCLTAFQIGFSMSYKEFYNCSINNPNNPQICWFNSPANKLLQLKSVWYSSYYVICGAVSLDEVNQVIMQQLDLIMDEGKSMNLFQLLQILAMSEALPEDKHPKVLRFLNDYRKKLSLLKIKSFYANHLCKKNCLEGRLLSNNDSCMKDCDQWLNKFYELKSQKNPDPQEMALVSSSEIPEAQRADYERGVAKLRLSINSYLQELQGYVNTKIQTETKK